MSLRVHIYRTRDIGKYEMRAIVEELKSLTSSKRTQVIADLERQLAQAEGWLKGKQGARRTGYQEEVNELRQQLAALKTTDARSEAELLRLLKGRTASDQHSLKEYAQRIGISSGKLQAMLDGDEPVSKNSRVMEWLGVTSRDAHPGIIAAAEKMVAQGNTSIVSIASTLIEQFRRQGTRITEKVRADCQEAATKAVRGKTTDAERITLSSIARAAKAAMPDVARLEVVRGNGYFYVVGEWKKKRGGRLIPITSGGIYTNRLTTTREDGSFGLSWWVEQVKDVVEKDRPYDWDDL